MCKEVNCRCYRLPNARRSTPLIPWFVCFARDLLVVFVQEAGLAFSDVLPLWDIPDEVWVGSFAMVCGVGTIFPPSAVDLASLEGFWAPNESADCRDVGRDEDCTEEPREGSFN
jgi:hypothetical protein